jgi:FkbM family methyltransferase
MEHPNSTPGKRLLEYFKSLIRPFYRSVQQVADWITPDKPSALAIGDFDGYQIAYRKGTADELVARHSFSNDIFFSGVPEYHPAEDHIIIEVGAHIGTFSILAASKAKRGHIYAIEASEDSANYLRINAALNRCDNLSVHQLALADKEGLLELYHDTGTWGHSTVKAYSQVSETVRATTLSAFMESNHIERCDFIKFNCEGAEFPILLSTSADVLKKMKMMLVLYHRDLWMKNSEADLIAHLESAGFTCKVRNELGPRGWIVAERHPNKTP